MRVRGARALPARLAWVLAAALAAASGACQKAGGPDEVADAFADAYFRRMDQEKAKEFTALGASAMLDEELRSVADVRKDGYSPGEDGSDVTIRRGPSSPREQRVRIPYEIVVKSDGGESIKDADVELTKIGDSGKVVRVGLKSR